ncbi:MAG: hypothetical protein JW888_12140 [Pirellulales bacterium]|nr:hypothetical protein [Pirellulales bacterium]
MRNWTIACLLACVVSIAVVSVWAGQPVASSERVVAVDQPPRQYLVSCKLTEKKPDGESRVLCSPRLVITENRLAQIHIGEKSLPPVEIEHTGPFFGGIRANFKIFTATNQTLYMDAEFKVSSYRREPWDSDGQSFSDLLAVVVETWSKKKWTKKSGQAIETGVYAHLVEPVTFDEKTVFPFGNHNMECEVMVRAVPPRNQINVAP